MMNIEKEFDKFFEFPTENKNFVTSTSAKLFARNCVHKACEELVEKPTEEELHFLESLLETQIQACEMVIRNTAKWEKQDRTNQAEREIVLSNQLLEKVRKVLVSI